MARKGPAERIRIRPAKESFLRPREAESCDQVCTGGGHHVASIEVSSGAGRSGAYAFFSSCEHLVAWWSLTEVSRCQRFHPNTPNSLVSRGRGDGKAKWTLVLRKALTQHILSCRLRQRALGSPLQQPVSVSERRPVQPYHRRLRVRPRLPRLAL